MTARAYLLETFALYFDHWLVCRSIKKLSLYQKNYDNYAFHLSVCKKILILKWCQIIGAYFFNAHGDQCEHLELVIDVGASLPSGQTPNLSLATVAHATSRVSSDCAAVLADECVAFDRSRF
jgi:hypothetical protein